MGILEVCTIDNEKIIYNAVDIAQNINKSCKNKGITAKDMLEVLNLGKNTMSHMLHGRAPSVITIARIADYLNVSVDYLLGRIDNTDINK